MTDWLSRLARFMELLLFPGPPFNAACKPRARPLSGTLEPPRRRRRVQMEPDAPDYRAARNGFDRGGVCGGVLTSRGREIPARCLDVDSVRPAHGGEAAAVARIRTGKWYRFRYYGPRKEAAAALRRVILAEAGWDLP